MPCVLVTLTKCGPFTGSGNRNPGKYTLFRLWKTVHWLVQCAEVLVSCVFLQEEYYVNSQPSEMMVMWLEAHQTESQVSWALFPVGSPAICVA